MLNLKKEPSQVKPSVNVENRTIVVPMLSPTYMLTRTWFLLLCSVLCNYSMSLKRKLWAI